MQVGGINDGNSIDEKEEKIEQNLESIKDTKQIW
jgi:hypothetical protein